MSATTIPAANANPSTSGGKKKKRASTGESKPRQRYDHVTPESFVQAWVTSSNVSEVADKLKMPKGTVTQRATIYRSKGVTLKEMPRGGGRALNIEKLNELVKSSSTEAAA